MTRTTEGRDPAMNMPSLWAKLQQFAEGLTPEEATQLRLSGRRAGVDSVNSEEADTRGHMIGAFNDGQSGKGRPAPVVGTGGGVPLGLQEIVNAVGFLAFTTGLLEGSGGLGGPAPQPGQS